MYSGLYSMETGLIYAPKTCLLNFKYHVGINYYLLAYNRWKLWTIMAYHPAKEATACEDRVEGSKWFYIHSSHVDFLPKPTENMWLSIPSATIFVESSRCDFDTCRLWQYYIHVLKKDSIS